MIEINALTIARMALQGLRLEQTPTEEEIEYVTSRLATAFEAQPIVALEARGILQARFAGRGA